MKYFDQNWCGLDWTAWVTFDLKKSDWLVLPNGEGVYRIRGVGSDFLMYVGQTGRSLRGRLRYLRRNVLADLMPFNDPHTAAPNLWVWKKEKNWHYECSAASTDFTKRERLAFEHFLLWQYRLERGESTLCNFGRFHPNYLKSTNRKKGFRGKRLSNDEERNPAGEKSHPPLHLSGKPLEENWMGLGWSRLESLNNKNVKEIPNEAGLYKIANLAHNDLMYIGQTKYLANRLTSHFKRFRKKEELNFSYSIMPRFTKDHELKEIENDLIASYYAQAKKPPAYQFSGS